MNNGLRLFRVAGVDVYVDWTWAIVIFYFYYAYQRHTGIFTHQAHGLGFWAAFLFCYMLIILLHEFGHVFACRWVGGKASRVTLSFMGGATGVRPPQRAAAMLWSIAGGPLVNMIILPVTLLPSLYLLTTGRGGMGGAGADFLAEVAWLNLVLLVLNMLPIYPMDGGQILRLVPTSKNSR